MKYTIALAVILISVFALYSAASAQYKITTSLPGTGIRAGDNVNQISVTSYVSQIYTGALALVGLIAVAAITYWGIIYTASGGNASKISDAKDGIKNAIFGVLLLISAFLILQTINPALVNLGGSTLNPGSLRR